ncbi:hypothetical protein GCM10009664_52950 [Kitasatospora gansuensis]
MNLNRRAVLVTLATGVAVSVSLSPIAQSSTRSVGGDVTSRIGQKVRAEPTTKSKEIGQYATGAKVRLACKVHGENVNGNDLWYRLANRDGWMSARFVRNSAPVAFCSDTGAAGAAGVAGAQGPKGDAGPVWDPTKATPEELAKVKGDKGDAGAQGPKGDAGPVWDPTKATPEELAKVKGDKGDAGAAGAQGPKGDAGAAGAQGPKGDAGAAGVQGAKGDAGPVWDPTKATPEELAKVKGDKGDAGAAGAQGPKGDKGEPGVEGTVGPQGPKGDKGDKGDAGAAGAAGTQGLKGDKGDKGDAGAAGAAGTQGLKGDKGDTGAAGAAGAQGSKGDKGDAGAAGAPKAASYVRASGTVPGNQEINLDASCSTGETLTGGGAEQDGTTVRIMKSFPRNGSTWRATFRNDSSGSVSVYTYAMCLPLS